MLASVQQEHDETLAYIRRAVGKTDAPLHSYFALVADDPSVQIVSIAQAWYIEQMLKGTEYEGLPILSAAAPFKAGGRGGPEYYTDVPKGRRRDQKRVGSCTFIPTRPARCWSRGHRSKTGWNAPPACSIRIEPGKADQVLLNASFPSYNFDVVDGVSYEIDLSQPSKFDPKGELLDAAANRIVNLTFKGQPIDPDQKFIIATNNYRASGGGKFPGALGDTIVFEGPTRTATSSCATSSIKGPSAPKRMPTGASNP